MNSLQTRAEKLQNYHFALKDMYQRIYRILDDDKKVYTDVLDKIATVKPVLDNYQKRYREMIEKFSLEDLSDNK